MTHIRRLLIADDHFIVRQGLKTIVLESYPRAVFGEAETGEELFKMLRQQEWDMITLDINMPGRGGLEVLEDVRHSYPHIPVLVLSVHPEDQYALRMLRAGASGYLTKASAPSELIEAIQRIMAGGKYISPSLAEKLANHLLHHQDRQPHETLSNREFQVLCEIASGKSVSEIAENLSLSVKTISTFRTRILTKMNLRNNAELTHYALQHRLVTPST